MTRISWIALFVLATGVGSAQQTSSSTEHTTTIQLQPKTPLNDPATLVASIRESYYHPDALSELDCDVSLDWPAFFTSLKTEIPPERMKAVEALKIKVKAQRGKTAEIDFAWTGEALKGGQDQFENGIKQMIGGFFQFYWPMAASTLIADAAEVTKVEPIPGAGLKVYTGAPGGSLVLDLNDDNSPRHYDLDTPALKATMDAQYVPSPNPVPGDLRRLSNMDVSEQIGTSSIHAGIGLGYQTVGEFIVPRAVTFNVPGAYSLKLELSGCTAAKDGLGSMTKQK